MRCYLLSEQLPSSGGQAGRDGWALHDTLFIPPNAPAPCKISLPIKDFITRDDFITLAPVCPSIANEPSPGSEGRLWPWSIQTNLNQSVIFVSMEAHLAASPSHPPSPVPLFYLLLTTKHILLPCSPVLEKFCCSHSLPVSPGWCWLSLGWVSRFLSGWQKPSHKPHTMQFLPSPLTYPGKTPSKDLPGLWNFVLLNF